VTPAEQIRLAWAVNSIYPGQPALAPTWELLDRLFIPQDPGLPVCLQLRDLVDGKIARAWRGSKTGWDWGADFRFFFTRSPFGVGRTEQGFTEYYDSAKTESGRPLLPADRVGGHSLGGPAATYDAAVGGVPGGAELLLAATPEPGDDEFSAWASPRYAAIHRWENPNDVVPDAPGRFLGYRDLVGAAVPIDMGQLGVSVWDKEGNHHLPNYIKAFQFHSSAL
jgi:hypothetical protein